MNPYVKLPKVPVVRGRQDIVLARCRGRRVLHVGCVDAGLLEERYRLGQLMHQRLAQVAAELWGVDLDRQGIAAMRQLGFPNLLVGDICQLEVLEELEGRQFDVIVASEVIEHLLNPGLFLAGARRLMTPGSTELIVTVPNAFRVDTLRWLLRGVEYVHPDHVYWFSYHTITNLLHKTGFTIEHVAVYSFAGPVSGAPLAAPGGALAPSRSGGSQLRTRLIRAMRHPARSARAVAMRVALQWLYTTSPFWGDGLVVVATANSPQGDT